MVGQISLVEKEEAGVWSVAYWTHPDCWGQGYATEILRRAVGFAFETLEAGRVWAAAGAKNEASLRVLQKGGLRFVRDNPEGYHIGGQTIPTREYELTRAQWHKTI